GYRPTTAVLTFLGGACLFLPELLDFSVALGTARDGSTKSKVSVIVGGGSWSVGSTNPTYRSPFHA
ncbi:MAG TPA: hypothetical protein VFA63_06120, partial [Pseudonocardiaceae bacterium]|nr:hypothetical protein [Pseudonocardiaceae bacterium]